MSLWSLVAALQGGLGITLDGNQSLGKTLPVAFWSLQAQPTQSSQQRVFVGTVPAAPIGSSLRYSAHLILTKIAICCRCILFVDSVTQPFWAHTVWFYLVLVVYAWPSSEMGGFTSVFVAECSAAGSCGEGHWPRHQHRAWHRCYQGSGAVEISCAWLSILDCMQHAIKPLKHIFH